MIYHFSFGEDIHALNWSDVHKAFVSVAPVQKILNVMDLILSIPPGSSTVEEDVKIKNLVKLKRKIKKGSSTLSDLIIVFRETADIRDYDPNADVQMWISEGMKTVQWKR